jgi:MFS family permease
LIWSSYIFFARTIEPKPQHAIQNKNPGKQKSLIDDFSDYKATLLKDNNFVRYLFSRSLFQLSGMAVAFFAVYGLQHYQLPSEQAGIFTALIFISGTLGFITFSLIGDRIGPRSTLLIADSLQAVILGTALLSPGTWSIYLIFFILGFAQSGYIIGELIIVMELGPDSERPIYIGLARTLPGLFMLVAPLIGGALVNRYDYSVMFLVALILSIGAFVLLLRVKDPKQHLPR